ncbi:MAG: hypothetical protein AAB896_01855, partial [Patescibacteria group bacterium]
RPRKIEQAGQGSEPNTQIVQTSGARMPKFSLLANKKRLYTGLIVLIAVIPTIYFYVQNKNTTDKLNDLQSKSQTASNLEEVVNQVGKLVILPSDEKPTLATISDVSKLQGQPFFASAANGDKVLVYAKAGRAILYRPSLNKIVEMAPLNSGDQPSP